MHKNKKTLLIAAVVLIVIGFSIVIYSFIPIAESGLSETGTENSISEFINMPEIIYSTDAPENGFSGTLMYADGKVFQTLLSSQGIVTVRRPTDRIYQWRTIRVFQTEYGKIGIAFSLNGESFLEFQGDDIRVYFYYAGYSNTMNMPIGFYIDHASLDELPKTLTPDMEYGIDIFIGNKLGNPDINEYRKVKYLVGENLPAGDYAFVQNRDADTSFIVSSDENGEFVIIEDSFESVAIYTLREGEYLTMINCHAISLIDWQATSTIPFDRYIFNAMYYVSYDILAGDHVLISKDGEEAYYAVYEDLRREILVEEGTFSGEKTITLVDDQILLTENCRIENYEKGW